MATTPSGSVIPEPDIDTDFTPTDYAEATNRVTQAREQFLEDPAAAAVHESLLTKIEERVNAKHATLAEIRHAVGLTQTQMAEMLDMNQGDVSRLERRSNLLLTTLARFIEATGGTLRIVATYGPTELDLQIGDLLGTQQPSTTGSSTVDSSQS